MVASMPDNRLRKPSWKDPRLMIGVLLVLVSVAGAVLLLGSADQTTDAYVSQGNIAVGQKIEQSKLNRVKVRLNDVQSSYYLANEVIPKDAVAVQYIPQGQLIAKHSVAQADLLGRKPVAIDLEQELPLSAAAGDRVDIWIAAADSSPDAVPKLLLPNTEIAALHKGKNGLSGNTPDVLYVLVDDQHLPVLLAALSNKSRISVVLNLAGSQS
ncbi:hypothetical protein [Psychromicrobium sp. YIM B11713]|uniref:hypothetical protein n=1 Tax=Psychromicrobium sp. YIM B11713 TaxID=3145233 RepID=UPI00374E7732